MKILGYEIKKIKKQRDLVFYESGSGKIMFSLDGDGWGVDEEYTYENQISDIIDQIETLDSSVSLETVVGIFKIFNSTASFQILTK